MAPIKDKVEAAANPLPAAEACTASSDDPCKDSKDVVEGSFAYMQGYLATQLEQLAKDLQAVDKPSWQEQLLEQCMDVALAVGGARVGEYIVEKAGHEFAEKAKAAAEFIKKSLEEAAPKGVKTAMEKLGDNESPNVDQFINAQKDGVMGMYQDAAAAFIQDGRHQLRNTREAGVLQRALDHGHLQQAAHRQYSASRDAYLTCLARQTLGTTKSGSTAMSGDGESGHAAGLVGALVGTDKGILVAQVLAYDDVRRMPGVWGSYLNGVNDTIREQYEDKPLGAMRIPRQLICSVRGDMEDFVVNVDETGAMELVSGDGAWLEARGKTAHPELANRSRGEQRRAGLELLLADLQITKIGHGEFR